MNTKKTKKTLYTKEQIIEIVTDCLAKRTAELRDPSLIVADMLVIRELLKILK